MTETLNFKSWKKLDMNLTTLSSLPDTTLLTLVQESENDVLEMITYYFTLNISAENKLQMFIILQKILKILPPNEKKQFITSGINIWLSKVIPTVMALLDAGREVEEALEVFVTLCEELGSIPEIFHSAEWKNIADNICNENKYPKILKSILENGSQNWHRLWIAFLKLLNQEVTTIVKQKGTPMNSMLPVVEAAFKMDTVTRCRAFECWRELIDNFAQGINDSSVVRRIKLLTVPLKVNNAKVSETVEEKFVTWWKFIRTFQPKLGNFVKEAIILFLQFCFGKPTPDSEPVIPSYYSQELKMKCVEALVEMTGHVYCDGCTSIPKLDGKLLCIDYLFNYWSEWTFSIRTAVLILATDSKESSLQQVRCMWKSILLVLTDLPENKVKADMVMELLNILTSMVKQCKSNNSLADLVFNGMILTIFDDEEILRALFRRSSKDMECSLKKIISLIVDESLTSYFESITPKEVVKKLKNVMNVLFYESLNSSSHIIEWVLQELPVNDNMLIIWTALAKNTCEFNIEICIKELCNMLLWPLINMNKFVDQKLPALAWYTMYSTTYKKLIQTEINEQISNILLSSNNNSCLVLCALLAVLKHDINEKSKICEKKVDLLEILMKDLSDYQDMKEIFSILVDTLVILLNYVTTSVNEDLARKVLTCIRNVLVGSEIANQPLLIIENLLESVNELFKIDSYSKYLKIVENELRQFKTKNPSNNSLNEIVNSVLYVSDNKPNISVGEPDETLLIATSDTSDMKDIVNKKDFIKPETPKCAHMKEPSIVNVVKVDGEEYVVVKSNWKFNPRKLTENQKEKMQKKREDIPALYQDLSQSQDEFKNTLWKMDSEDTSNSSKSASSDAVFTLKELPSSNVVPNVTEMMLVDNIENNPKEDKLPKVVSKAKQQTPKSDRSPRMTLKDRVFRNVKMLTENCGANKTVTEAQIRTPQSKPRKHNDIVNSAPAQLLVDRPSRAKRLPKKFDDTEIFAVSKRLITKDQSNEKESTFDKAEFSEDQQSILDLENTDKIPDIGITPEILEEEPKENVDINIDAGKNKKIEDEPIASSSSLEDIKRSSLETNCKVKLIPMILEAQLERNIEMTTVDIKPIKSSIKEIICSNSPNPDEKDANETCPKTNYSVDLNTAPSITNTDKEEKVKSPSGMTQKTLKDKSKNKDETKSSVKKCSKISRIEKALAIDMVEGHPLLQSDKRSTRKSIQSTNVGRRISLADKINKAKLVRISTKSSKRTKTTDSAENLINTGSIEDIKMSENVSSLSQNQLNLEELSCSEDIIESSQDSTFTTISVTKKTPIKELIVKVDKFINMENNQTSQDLLRDSECQIMPNDEIADKKNSQTLIKENAGNPNGFVLTSETSLSELHSDILSDTAPNQKSKDDTEIPVNKTAIQDKTDCNLTEEMETEPLDDNFSNDLTVALIEEAPITISSEEIAVGTETQEIAEDDTQPAVSQNIFENETGDANKQNKVKDRDNIPVTLSLQNDDMDSTHCTQDEATKSITESLDRHLSNVSDRTDVSSPFKDDSQRKQNFLNDTSEISPIKILSPERNKKSPSPDTSNDYVVIKLSTPVRSNGEPFEKNESPEFFTEDKVSPDKRDQSPPRLEISVTNNTSPSSSLSLKKNRPQVRPSGRAAQMLGLCVPDKLNSIMNSEKNESEVPKRNSPSNTQARRNLRLLYNAGADTEVTNESENENFLRFKRKLPSVDSSPSCPILKRKLVDIEDEHTVSPAGKRKRVSFHDPPVSTTIAVQKYIEPCGLRSPQNSAKRVDRQLRSFTYTKSPKRLDNAFKLDTVLNRAVESFTEVDIVPTNTEDTQSISLEITPAIEIVRASELNDKDPICPELVECKDTIDNIAAKLSSTTAKSWLLKELQGKIESVGDLAKMTELEVNRLCIKAPKVKTAKRVLADYVTEFINKVQEDNEMVDDPLASLNSIAMDSENLPSDENIGPNANDTTMLDEEIERGPKTADIDVQTFSTILTDTAMQTVGVDFVESSSQTCPSISHTSVQTNEIGEKKTADIIALCIKERSDFVHLLSDQLDESSIEKLSEKLPLDAIIELITKRLSGQNASLSYHSDENSEELLLNIVISLISNFKITHNPNKMLLFCGKLLKKISEINDKPT